MGAFREKSVCGLPFGIGAKFSLALSIPILGAVVVFIAFSMFLERTDNEVIIADVAGGQRMLSEQMLNYANMVHGGQDDDRKLLLSLIARFDASLDLLEKGGRLHEYELQGIELSPASPGTVSSIRRVREAWLPLKDQLLLVANLPVADPRAVRAWSAVSAGLPGLTGLANQVVKDYAAYSQQQRRQMRTFLGANILFGMLLLVLVIYLVRRCIVGPVTQLTEAAEEIDEGNYSRQVSVHSRDELGRLATVFNNMASGIKNALHRERRLRQRQEGITDAVISLGSQLADESVLHHVGELAMQMTDARYAMLAHQVDGARRCIFLGLDDAERARLEKSPPLGAGLPGVVWKEHRVVRVDNIREHPDSFGFPPDHPPMTSFLGVPVEFAGEVVGAIYLTDKSGGRPFSDDDEVAIRILASACGMALANCRHFRELETMNAELDTRVRERTEELSRSNQQLRKHEIELELMNEELGRANEAKNQFLANTSHELRTPLNAIIGFSEMMLTYRCENLTEKQRSYAEYIHNSGKNLLEIINDLLDLSKIEAGMMEINETHCSLPLLFGNVRDAMMPLANKKQIELKPEEMPETPGIITDVGKLRQVLVNLVGNAIKFTPEGGSIEMTYGLEPADEGMVLKVAVQDTGIGIHLADQEGIFQPFVQAEGGMDRSHGGTGLGLPLTRRLLQMQGGDIGLDSEPGKGSRFYFSLPTRVAGEVESAETAGSGVAAGSQPAEKRSLPEPVEEVAPQDEVRPRILIVDDDSVRAAAVGRMLDGEGYETSLTDMAHVEEDALGRNPFLIMLGIPSDPVDIYKRLHLVRSSRDTRNLPLVLLGGDADEPNFSFGTIDNLDKSMSKQDLVDVISRHGRRLSVQPTILVIDDEASVRDYMKEALSSEGYRVLLAPGGEEGVRVAIEREPDLIILDLMMPVVSGFDVVERLKRHPVACDIPVLIFTAKDLTREEVLQLGQEVEKVLIKGVSGHRDILRELRSLELMYPVQAKLVDATLGLYNNRYLKLRLEQELSRAVRYKQKFSLAGWQMDNFEEYVRRHGLRWANAALKEMVEMLKTAIRKGDVAIRMSEDRFVLLLPGIEPEGASRVTEKIRLRIQRQRFPLSGDHVGHLTASFGVVHCDRNSPDATTLLHNLNQRIDRAVATGGDRCISEGDD